MNVKHTGPEIRNAVIESVSLGDDDHGGLTFWLHLDYGHSSQGFGGYFLGSDRRPPLVFMHLTVREILRVIGVSRWEDLAHKTCRAEITDGFVSGIGHVVKDEWFRPKEAFAPYIESEQRIARVTDLAEAAQRVLDLLIRLKGEDFAAESYEVRLLREQLAGGTQ